VIAVDSNILVYAHREDSPWHIPAAKRLTELAESGSPWAIPWPCVHEFLGIVTNPRIYKRPSVLTEALAQVEAWFECPWLHLIGEISGYWEVLESHLRSGRIVGSMVHDAKIMAICQQHGIQTLWSADRDFSRFKGIDVINPLLSTSQE
jgi:toxin-antitoxin system PIN domain toxin